MPTQQDWNRYLLRFEELREHPLAVSWIKRRALVSGNDESSKRGREHVVRRLVQSKLRWKDRSIVAREGL
jgi:hypothetical protein